MLIFERGLPQELPSSLLSGHRLKRLRPDTVIHSLVLKAYSFAGGICLSIPFWIYSCTPTTKMDLPERHDSEGLPFRLRDVSKSNFGFVHELCTPRWTFQSAWIQKAYSLDWRMSLDPILSLSMNSVHQVGHSRVPEFWRFTVLIEGCP